MGAGNDISHYSHLSIDTKRVRAVVFDLGGVLIEGGPAEVRAFGKRVGLDDETWERLRREIFGNEGTWARLERGEIDFDAFVEGLAERINAAGGSADRELASTFMGRATPLGDRSIVRDEMVDEVRRLKRVVATALLTNNVREWRSGWSEIFHDPALFDVVVDSSEVGARKPEPAIYEETRRLLGVDHEDILFVDDIGQNLKAARALGWQTVLYREMAEVLGILSRIGGKS